MILNGGHGERSPSYEPVENNPDAYELSSSTRASHRATIEEAHEAREAREQREPNNIAQTRSPSDWFVWEFACVLISGGILAAVVVLLAVYDQRPQPSWRYISLNAVISWLSTLSKGSLLFAIGELLGQLKWVWFAQKERPLSDLRSFDSASRGAWGSLELFWTLRARNFALWGALSMLLALGFDPFAQNLIHSFSKEVADPSGTAQLGNVSVYDYYGPVMLSGVSYVDPALKANVYNSLFNNDPSRPWAIPSYFCSSSNCTWDPVASLEFRPVCANVTNELKTECHKTPKDGDTGGLTNCTVTLPKSNTSAWFVPNDTMLTPFVVQGVVDRDALVYGNSSTLSYIIQYISPRANYTLVRDMGASIDNHTQWEATECAIQLIVRSFRAKVQQNVYSEETLDIWDEGALNSSDPLNPHPGWYLTPSSWGPDLGVQHFENNRSQSFILGQFVADSTNTFLADIFAGKAYRGPMQLQFTPGSQTSMGIYAGSDVLQALGMGNITGCNDMLADRLTCAIENVAAAMTKSARDSAYIADSATAAMASGSCMASETFIEVHWQWVVLPVAVWALGAVFVVGTLFKTRRTRVPGWRNDTLPLLFLYSNVEGRELDENMSQSDPGTMVRLSKKDGRLFFRRPDEQ